MNGGNGRSGKIAPMLKLPIFALRYLLWLLGNLRQRLKKPPDYVVFILEGEFPELKAPRAGFFRRRLFPSAQFSLQELGEQFKALQQDHRVIGRGAPLWPSWTCPRPRLRPCGSSSPTCARRASGSSPGPPATTTPGTTWPPQPTKFCCRPEARQAPVGLHGAAVFLGDALKEVGVQADFIRISPYKTAADPLMRSSMSDEAREMSNWLADAHFQELVGAIAGGRGIDEAAARSLVDAAPYTDLRAMEAGVVDRLVSEEDLPEYLGAKLRDDDKPARLANWDMPRNPSCCVHRRSLEEAATSPSFASRAPSSTAAAGSRPSNLPCPRPSSSTSGPATCRSCSKPAGPWPINRAAAVVLYVDSPGGSASASEAMASALQKLAAKKPLVAVMGPVAASGGYYVSTACPVDNVARPGSVTGSIGVLAGKMVLSGLLDKLLLGRESVNRGLHADLEASETALRATTNARLC